MFEAKQYALGRWLFIGIFLSMFAYCGSTGPQNKKKLQLIANGKLSDGILRADIAMVQEALDEGADVFFEDFSGSTPWTNMLRNDGKSRDAILKVLISKGVDIDAKNVRGTSALHKSLEDKNYVYANTLLAYHADVNIKNENDENVLYGMVKCFGTDCFKNALALVRGYGIDLDSRNKRGETVLDFAIMSGEFQNAEQLIKAGANVNNVTNNGEITLNYFGCLIDERKKPVFELLIKFGAHVNHLDRSGRTVLQALRVKNVETFGNSASEKDCRTIVGLLKDAGAKE
jgi:ankyrin repeat protein